MSICYLHALVTCYDLLLCLVRRKHNISLLTNDRRTAPYERAVERREALRLAAYGDISFSLLAILFDGSAKAAPPIYQVNGLTPLTGLEPPIVSFP